MSDLILSHAKVFTMDDDNPFAEAIHIQGNIIKKIGSNDEILAGKNNHTTILSVNGKTIMPGFIDSHAHIFPGSNTLGKLNLMEVYDFDNLKLSILNYVSENKGLSFVEGQATHYKIFERSPLPSRKQLDQIVSDKPMLLVAPDHHTAWANTKALIESEILGGRNLPEGNEIVMAQDGLAEGMLKEGEAIKLVNKLKPISRAMLGLDTGGEPDKKPTLEEREADLQTLKIGLRHLASLGITSLHNMDGNLYTLELLEQIKNSGDLTCRIKVPFHFKPDMEKSKLDLAGEMNDRWNDDFLSSGFVKFFMDGVIGSGTAFFADDYADRPGWRGDGLYSEKRFKDLVLEVDKRNLQIAVHAIGDAAVNRVINAYAYAREINGSRDARHRIEHIELILQEDLNRLNELEIIASMQPVHPPGSDGLPLEPEISKIGEGRYNQAYAWKSIHDSGTTVIFSTDWPVSNVDPINCIHNALNRRKWSEKVVDQRLSLIETLKAYTKWGAYAEFKESKKGILKKGYFADLVVLSDKIDQIDLSRLQELFVEYTICNGRVVYQRN